MADITLSDISNAMGFNEKEPAKDFSYYGTIVSEDVENDTYQVSINRDPSTTVTASRMTGAKVGDVVIVTVMANGHASVTSCKGGDRDALKAIADAEAADAKADTAAQKADAIVSDVEAANKRIDGIDGDYKILNQDYKQYKIDTNNAIGSVQTRVSEAEDALGNKVNVNEYNTKIQSINQNISAMGQTITDQDGRISSAESSITQNAKAILSKVTASVEGAADMVSYINQTASSVKIKAQHIVIDGDLIVGKDFVNDAVDNIEIGGRNLFYLTPRWEEKNAYNSYQLELTENLVKGDTYTIQLWGMSVDSNCTGFRIYWGGGSNPIVAIIDKSEIKNGYYKLTFTAPNTTHEQANNTWLSIYSFPAGRSGQNLAIDKWKIEKGDKATDYSISPEDTELTDNYNLIANAKTPRIKNLYQPNITVASGGNGKGMITYINDPPAEVVKTHNNQAWIPSYRIFSNNAGYNRDFQQIIPDFANMWTDGEWTFSAWVRVPNSGTVTALIRVYGANQNFTYSQSVTTTWTKLEIPIKLTGTKGTMPLKILFGMTGAGDIQYVEPRLTRGYAKIRDLDTVRNTASTASTNASNALSKLSVKDTRNDNQNPQWYMTNYPKQSVIELKLCSKIGLPTSGVSGGMYCYLRTDVPWTDGSGGHTYPKQVAEVNNKQYVRVGTSDTAWGAWEAWSDYITFSSTGGLSIKSNRVNATKAYVNIKSDGIRMYDDAGAERLYIGSNVVVDNVKKTGVRVGSLTDNATITSDGMVVNKGNVKIATFSDAITLGKNKEIQMRVSDETNRLAVYSPEGPNYDYARISLLASKQRSNVTLYTQGYSGFGCVDIGADKDKPYISLTGSTLIADHLEIDVSSGISVYENIGLLCTSMDDKYVVRPYTTSSIPLCSALGNGSYPTRIYGTKILKGNGTAEFATSDERIKKDFIPIDNAKDFLMDINTFSFKWDTDSELWEEEGTNDGRRNFGVSAQQVLKTLKEHDIDPDEYSLVSSDEHRYYVSYEQFIPLLIRTVQDQQKEIDELKHTIKTVKMEVN